MYHTFIIVNANSIFAKLSFLENGPKDEEKYLKQINYFPLPELKKLIVMVVFKSPLAVISGCIAGIVVISIGEACLGAIFPLPAGIDYHNKIEIGKAIAAMPMAAFVLLLASHMAAAFCGGLLATMISKKEKARQAIIVGIVLTLAGLYNTWLIPHPMWFTVINAVSYLPLAYLGYAMVKKKSSNPTA